MSLGLDELMIVNPAVGGLSAVFLGRDGRLWGVEEGRGEGRYFLGDDGSLYQAGTAGSGDPTRFFLGNDGTLYQRVDERLR